MRYLVLSDIHGNAVALREVLKSAKYDAIIFLGDAVDYGPQPAEVIDILREEKPEVWIKGNHDDAVATGKDCGCSPLTHHLSVLTRERISMVDLDSNTKRFLGNRPLEAIIGKYSIFCIHGSPNNPLYGYFLLEEKSFMEKVGGGYVEQSYVLIGHTHIPKNFKIEGWRIFNPGSVGQPRDGNPQASYGILDTESMKFELHRVNYDIDRVANELKKRLGKEATELIKILREGKI